MHTPARTRIRTTGLEEAFPAVMKLLETAKRRGLIGTFSVDSSDYDPGCVTHSVFLFLSCVKRQFIYKNRIVCVNCTRYLSLARSLSLSLALSLALALALSLSLFVSLAVATVAKPGGYI